MSGSSKTRQNKTARRLRCKLRKTRESLADEFEFKMFVIIHFKNESKKRAVFEIEQVYPLMTNDYEHKLMEEDDKNGYSVKSSVDLLTQDVVQLHARKWQCKRRDVIGCSDSIDFMIWPRKDIDVIECQLFSRWRHETTAPFRPYAPSFSVRHEEYEARLEQEKLVSQPSGCVITNSEQTMFLFLSQHILDSTRGLASIFRINSLCVYLPQAELMNWSGGTMRDIMEPLLANI